MAGPGGIVPFLPALIPLPAAATLQTGATYPGVVRESGGQQILHVAGNRVPLSANSEAAVALKPGQAVQVEVFGKPGALQLRVTPAPAQTTASPTTAPPQQIPVPQTTASQPAQQTAQPQTATPQTVLQPTSAPVASAPPVVAQAASLPAAPTASAAPAIVQAALQALGAVHVADTMRALLPAFAQRNVSAVRLLATLFLKRDTVGADARQIATVVTKALDAGLLPRTLGEAIAAQLSVLFDDEAPTQERLQQLLAQTRRSVEARMTEVSGRAASETSAEAHEGDIIVLLMRLRGDATFTRHLRSQGGLEEFQQAVDRLTERLSSGQLQNLRGLEVPYAFIELPSNRDLTRAQIHVFGDGQNGRDAFAKENATIALDLSLSRIGELWIALDMRSGRCSCTFRAVDQDIVDTLNEHADALREKLAENGYPGAQVSAVLWNGDRLEAAAALMHRADGFSMSA